MQELHLAKQFLTEALFLSFLTEALFNIISQLWEEKPQFPVKKNSALGGKVCLTDPYASCQSAVLHLISWVNLLVIMWIDEKCKQYLNFTAYPRYVL